MFHKILAFEPSIWFFRRRDTLNATHITCAGQNSVHEYPEQVCVGDALGSNE